MYVIRIHSSGMDANKTVVLIKEFETLPFSQLRNHFKPQIMATFSINISRNQITKK